MKLIDADILKDGIKKARAEIRVNFENGQMNHSTYIIMMHVLDVFEDTVDIMPEYHTNEKRGDKK